MLPDPLFLNVHMYGVMIAVGILAAFGILMLYGKKLGIHEKFIDFIFYNGIASIFVGFGSAALFQAIYDYIENPAAGFHFSGSITFLGGLIGGTVCFLVIYFILRRRLTEKLSDTLSIFPCMITVGHAFGRVGCFFAGCCYGKPTDSIFGVTFAPGSSPARIYPGVDGRSIPLLPTQLYEAIFLFVLFGVLSYLLLKKNFKHNMSIYLIAYGIFRFCIEFLRGDSRGELVAGISPSQFWSLCMIVLGIAIYFPLQYIFNKKKALEE